VLQVSVSNYQHEKPPKAQLGSWEPCAYLSSSINYELLQTLRLDVVKYLNWVTHDLMQTDPQKALREIQRAADRLTRITAMIPGASAAHMEDYRREVAEAQGRKTAK
jgi:hypothetical protein